MKAILQRVASASVTVDTQLISSIGKGVLVFAAVAKDDTRKEVEAMAGKVLKLKMWPDDTGSTWKQSVQDIKGEVLCGKPITMLQRLAAIHVPGLNMYAVSQFTLLASTKKGNKPDFHGAAGGEHAKELYDHFFAKVQEMYDSEKVKNGVFQAMMEVNIQNSGPVGVDYSSHDEAVTLEIDTNPQKVQESSTEIKQMQDGSNETTAEKREDNIAESFQIPAELLE